MKLTNQWSKHMYPMLALISIFNILLFGMSGAIYIGLFYTAGNLVMMIIPIVIPIGGFGFATYNITTFYKNIKAHNKEIENE